MKTAKLRNLTIKPGGVQTGPFGSQLHKSDYADVGTPIITVEHLGDNRIIHKNLPNVSDSDKLRLSKYVMQTGDIIFSRVGSVDRRALVRKEENGWLFSGRCLRIRSDKSIIDSEYLSYYLGLDTVKEHIRRIAVGATMPSLNTSLLGNVEINFPNLITQKQIASILGSLDDKIELNRRMNETLEGMARALFKSWFVDFDPVIDNALAAGNPIPEPLQQKAAKRKQITSPLPPEIRSMFPNSFQESPLGLIPEGWEVKTIEEVVTIKGGSTPSTKKSEYWEDGAYYWATPKDLSKLNSPILLDTERKITDVGLETISSKQMPEGTLLMSSRAPVGYLAISTVPISVNQGFIAMICDGPVSNQYVLRWCQENMEAIQARASGTTFQEISKKNFRPMNIIIPDRKITDQYSDIAKSLFNRQVLNEKESVRLSKSRDTLLPQLMSGKLIVN